MNNNINNVVENNNPNVGVVGNQNVKNRPNLEDWMEFQNGPGHKNSKKPQNNLEYDNLVYTCKDTSIAYLWMWLFEIIFIVVTGIFFAKILFNAFGGNIIVGNVSINLINIQNDPFYIVYAIMLAISVVWGFIILILGIALSVKTYKLNKIYGDCGSLWILFLIGIFLVFPGIVGAFITTMTSNWLLKTKR